MKKYKIFKLSAFIILLVLVLLNASCNKEEPNIPPDVPTSPNPDNNSLGLSLILDFCWECTDSEGDSLIYDLYLGTETDPPLLISDLTINRYTAVGLIGEKTYYWKIVVRDGSYNEVISPVWSFTTGLFMYDDRDSTIYPYVKIGNQSWLVKNLNTDSFMNGDLISEAKSDKDWDNAGRKDIPAWCYFDNSPDNGEKYGKLYNFHAVNDPRGIAPDGWHVPSDYEWKVLEMELGMSISEAAKLHDRGTNQGTQLKDPGDPTWELSTTQIDYSGFNALASGGRFCYTSSDFWGGKAAFFWTSTETPSGGAWARGLHALPYVNRCDDPKGYGMSIRLIKD